MGREVSAQRQSGSVSQQAMMKRIVRQLQLLQRNVFGSNPMLMPGIPF